MALPRLTRSQGRGLDVGRIWRVRSRRAGRPLAALPWEWLAQGGQHGGRQGPGGRRRGPGGRTCHPGGSPGDLGQSVDTTGTPTARASIRAKPRPSRVEVKAKEAGPGQIIQGIGDEARQGRGLGNPQVLPKASRRSRSLPRPRIMSRAGTFRRSRAKARIRVAKSLRPLSSPRPMMSGGGSFLEPGVIRHQGSHRQRPRRRPPGRAPPRSGCDPDQCRPPCRPPPRGR